MTFGDAIVLAKSGESVSRSGWNGKGMWVTYVPKGEITLPRRIEDVHSHPGDTIFKCLPFLAMKTVDGSLIPWLASQADILAEDWNITK